jgi:hypothetical protein
MAFRRWVTPMRTGAETLRWGSVRGSGRAPSSFHPCGAASARPHRDRGQSKLVPGDVGVVLNEVTAEHDVQQGYALADLRDSTKTRDRRMAESAPRRAPAEVRVAVPTEGDDQVGPTLSSRPRSVARSRKRRRSKGAAGADSSDAAAAPGNDRLGHRLNPLVLLDDFAARAEQRLLQREGFQNCGSPGKQGVRRREPEF